MSEKIPAAQGGDENDKGEYSLFGDIEKYLLRAAKEIAKEDFSQPTPLPPAPAPTLPAPLNAVQAPASHIGRLEVRQA